jgi:hypothetical protein
VRPACDFGRSATEIDELHPASAANSVTRVCAIVAGMHRSGTSMTTRVISLLGADIASDLLPPVSGQNDRGFWESARVVQIHDELLHAIGSSWDDPLPLPAGWIGTDAAREARRQLAKEVQKCFSTSQFFVIKDPRISRLLPLWLELLDDAGIRSVIVVPVRNPLEIAASLKRRNEFPLAKSLLLYLRASLEAELASRGRRRLFVRYEQLVADWRPLSVRLKEAIGAHLTRTRAESLIEISCFLSSELYRNKFTREELCEAEDIAAVVVDVYERLTKAADGTDQNLEDALDGAREKLTEATKLFQGLVLFERRTAAADIADARAAQARAETQAAADIADARAAQARAETQAAADIADARAAQARAETQAAADIADARTAQARAEAQLAAILGSSTWRATEPLRNVLEKNPFLRRCLGRCAELACPGKTR